MIEENPDRIGEFAVGKRLGSGATSVVYMAHKIGTGTKYAIKVPLDRRHHAIIKDEARLGLRLGHRNVVRVVKLIEHNQVPCLVMPVALGAMLSRLLVSPRGMRPIAQRLTAQVVRSAALGLHHIHCATAVDGTPMRAVHGDVKPANVLITRGGVVRVCDYGVSMFEGRRTLAEAGSVCGTPSYMAPEQVQAHHRDHRADIFVLGTMLYEMLMAITAFYGHDSREIMTKIAVGDYGDKLESFKLRYPLLYPVLERCWRVQPGDRYSSAQELALELQGLCKKLPKVPRNSPQTLKAWVQERIAI